MKIKSNKNIGFYSVLAFAFMIQYCSGDNSNTNKKSGKTPASENGEQTQKTPSPDSTQPTTPQSPDVANDQAGCETKWTQFVAYLKPNLKLEYSGTLAAGSMSYPVKHTETVISSTNDSVVRKIEFSSSSTIGALILSSSKIPSEFAVTKQKYIAACLTPTSSDSAVSPLLNSKVQVTENKIETITAQGASQSTQFLKLQSKLVATPQIQFDVLANVWLSTKVSGIVLIQNVEMKSLGGSPVASMPSLSTITINDSLISPVIQ